MDSNRVWVGGYGLLALPELEIWRRLFLADGLALPVRVLIQSIWTATDLELATAMVAPSQASELRFLAGEIGPEIPRDRIFAWHPATGTLMLGPPTEDAWEQLRAELGR